MNPIRTSTLGPPTSALEPRPSGLDPRTSDRDVRDLPNPPRSLWRIVGPGVVAAGVGISSGEFILWPYIASQVGLVFLWAAVLGILTQLFLNMEIERYTLATAETAVAGFNRFWKHWGLVFALMVYFANLWPGWALSSATLATFLFGGGDPRWIAIGVLLVIGVALTLAPVVYVALERLIFLKVAAVLTLVTLALILAVHADTWRALPAGLFGVGHIPRQLGFALLLGAVAFAGAGGGQNLCQSNWIRDKGFGMGQYVPRLVSPLTGEAQADSQSATGYIFDPTPANMSRWKRWWWFANIEQPFTFALVSIVTICLTSMMAHSTLYGVHGLPSTVAFCRSKGASFRRWWDHGSACCSGRPARSRCSALRWGSRTTPAGLPPTCSSPRTCATRASLRASCISCWSGGSWCSAAASC